MGHAPAATRVGLEDPADNGDLSGVTRREFDALRGKSLAITRHKDSDDPTRAVDQHSLHGVRDAPGRPEAFSHQACLALNDHARPVPTEFRSHRTLD
jgi:hypothetical protein